MKNQKLVLADFQENQLSKTESSKVTGGKTTIIVYIDANGDWFDAEGEPIQNPGHGSGKMSGDVEYIFIKI